MLKLLTTIAVLLWIAVGMAELVSLAPIPHDYVPVNNKDAKQSQDCGKENNPSFIRVLICASGSLVDTYHDDITAGSTLVIAFFTGIFGWFTISLSKATRIAVDAAKQSSDAALAIELPIIRCSIPNLIIVDKRFR